jgi:hypothetical protein
VALGFGERQIGADVGEGRWLAAHEIATCSRTWPVLVRALTKLRASEFHLATTVAHSSWHPGRRSSQHRWLLPHGAMADADVLSSLFNGEYYINN